MKIVPPDWAIVVGMVGIGIAATRVVCPGCVDHSRANSNCEWAGDTAFRIEVTDGRQWRHLVGDAQLAEELAVRYADARFYRWAFPVRTEASGPVQTSDTHADNVRAQRTCLDRLGAVIENAHAVTAEEVEAARGARNPVFDTIVLLLFAPLYLSAARAVCLQFGTMLVAGTPRLRIIAVAIMSVSISALGLNAFFLWQKVMEGMRVGNPDGHFGYRAAAHNYWSAPFGATLLVCGILVFWMIAAWVLPRTPGASSTRRT